MIMEEDIRRLVFRTGLSVMKVSLKNLIMTALTCSLMGCASLNFYTQAVTGQVQLLLDRQSIDIVLAEPTVSQEVKNKLLLSRDVLKFAEEELGLPVEDSYSSYVDTGRRFVVWNVFAAEEFSAELQTFCYPIAGCVSYRGFFKEEAAQAFAAKLRQQGYEIFVGGVAGVLHTWLV
jgi:predicted aminopeptidase